MISFASRLQHLRRRPTIIGCSSINLLRQKLHNVPFQDDLTPIDEDLFNLQDFQDYKEAPDVLALKKKLGIPESTTQVLRKDSSNLNLDNNERALTTQVSLGLQTFEDYCNAKEPVVFVSKVQNPYLNLAIEDYIYNKMSIPKDREENCNRLLFYINTPCVVIGKNQNPWREVNLALLNNLRLPLVRRRSGGGTVVHDTGNVNYSFMTTRDKFDRFTFANLVTRAVNQLASPSKQVQVNSRGDVVTQEDAKKVSGSAYKISKGKSYHHGTMLLNLKLDILRQLLHRDESKSGSVHAMTAVSSVSSPVTNLGIDLEAFIEAVTSEFQDAYGIRGNDTSSVTNSSDDIDQTELLGLSDLVSAFSPKSSLHYEIDDSCELPEAIKKVRDELMQWDWRFGATPKFLHHFEHLQRNISVKIEIGPKAVITNIDIEGDDQSVESFNFLKEAIEKGREILYTGSNVAGYVLDDELSEWIGEAIDGTS